MLYLFLSERVVRKIEDVLSYYWWAGGGRVERCDYLCVDYEGCRDFSFCVEGPKASGTEWCVLGRTAGFPLV